MACSLQLKTSFLAQQFLVSAVILCILWPRIHGCLPGLWSSAVFGCLALDWEVQDLNCGISALFQEAQKSKLLSMRNPFLLEVELSLRPAAKGEM